MEERAQVSFDYLIILTFVLGLVVVVSALVTAVQNLSRTAIGRVIDYRAKTLSSILSR